MECICNSSSPDQEKKKKKKKKKKNYPDAHGDMGCGNQFELSDFMDSNVDI